MSNSDQDFFRGDPLSGPGWICDYPDPEDKVYSVGLSTWPSSVYLPKLYPNAFQSRVEDQLQSSSCSGNASVTWAEFAYCRKTGKRPNFARLLNYWGARSYRGWQNRDSGSIISDNFKWMSERGIALESYYPFKMENLFLVPSQEVLDQASRHRITDARRVSRDSVLAAIAAGYPVVGGFTCFNQAVFGELARETGFIRLNQTGDTRNGGHAVCFSWYDETLGLIGGPNSWGVNWGRKNRIAPGWFEMPLDYIFNPNLSDDFWTATDVLL